MKNKNFNQEIIELLKEMAIAFLQAIKMFFIDLQGFRNRLITFVCVLGILLVISEKSQTGAQVSVLGIIGVIISYYFKQRNDSKKIDCEEENEDEKY
ncbi:MAG: hypothetical protein NC222_06380 [Staphylococcus sp.]|nr:hypothetical protein [Staphylococcus sp.]